MSKFKYINKKGQVSISLKLVGNEQINTGMAGYLAGNHINGFIRPAADASGGIIYTGVQGMALSQFFRRPISKDQFYIIIAHLLEAYKMIVTINLDPSMINLDPDYITINENTGDIYLVYQPIINSQTRNQGFMRCFGQICSMLKYASPQDQASVQGFINFASRMPAFSVNNIEGYIMSVSPFTYNIVHRIPFNEPAPVNPPSGISAQPDLSNNATVFSPDNKTVYGESENSGLSDNATVFAPDDKIVYGESENSGLSDNATVFAPDDKTAYGESENSELSDSATVFAPEDKEPVIEKPAAPVVPEKPVNSEKPAAPVVPEKPVNSEKPVEPVVLEKPVAPKESLSAKLIRKSNGEEFIINKKTYVLGKERARVNGCITGNNTISRVHASIVLKPDGYYIIDNGSSNKTYINGTVVKPLKETRINNGDVLRLSNEDFDFIS